MNATMFGMSVHTLVVFIAVLLLMIACPAVWNVK